MATLTSERVEIGVGIELAHVEEPVPQVITRTEAIHSASRILLWNAVAAPWIARTEPYNHALLSGRPIPQEDPNFLAMFRVVEAQVVLDRRDTQKIICLGATALLQRYGSDPHVHQQQLQHLLDISTDREKNVRLHILPHAADASPVVDKGAVTLYEHASRPPIAEEETWTRGIILTDNPGAVSEMQMIFAALTQRSLDHDESVSHLQEVLEQFS